MHLTRRDIFNCSRHTHEKRYFMQIYNVKILPVASCIRNRKWVTRHKTPVCVADFFGDILETTQYVYTNNNYYNYVPLLYS
jgi:hypothetical protein